MIIILVGKMMIAILIMCIMYNWIELFVSMYNNTIVTKSNIILIKEVLSFKLIEPNSLRFKEVH